MFGRVQTQPSHRSKSNAMLQLSNNNHTQTTIAKTPSTTSPNTSSIHPAYPKTTSPVYRQKHNRSTALPQTYTTRQPYQTITNTSPTSPKHRQHITRQINCNYVVWSVEYIYNIYIYILYILIYNKTEILKIGWMVH